MSESKGKIAVPEQDEMTNQDDNFLLKCIHYQISTYKGQSGSPIFLRIKKISDKNF